MIARNFGRFRGEKRKAARAERPSQFCKSLAHSEKYSIHAIHGIAILSVHEMPERTVRARAGLCADIAMAQ